MSLELDSYEFGVQGESETAASHSVCRNLESRAAIAQSHALIRQPPRFPETRALGAGQRVHDEMLHP